MRTEIQSIIDNSGLRPDEEIWQGYREMLRRFNNHTEEQILELTNSNLSNPDNFGKLKHQIYLDNYQINDQEIEEIAHYIVIQKPLTHSLNLGHNLLTDEGVHKLCQIIKDLNHLISLCLVGNDMGHDGFYDVFTLYAMNRKLNLSLRGNQLNEVGAVENIKWKAIADYEKLHNN